MTNRGGPLTVAIPKGRVLSRLVPLLSKAGLDAGRLLEEDRKLVRELDGGAIRTLLLKPDDVPTWVEYGAAELGVVGRDVLLERGHELYQPLDLGIGRCRMVVAGRPGAVLPDVPRVATKYVRVATEHFAARGVQAEVIYVQGSVELAPVTGLSDLVVDLVETGTTLRQNGLEERETIAEVTSVVVANRTLFKLRHGEVAGLLDRLRRAAAEG